MSAVPETPRRVTSIEDLKVGQVVAIQRRDEEGTWVIQTISELIPGSTRPCVRFEYVPGGFGIANVDYYPMVILQDPPPEPVMVPRALIDNLRDACPAMSGEGLAHLYGDVGRAVTALLKAVNEED